MPTGTPDAKKALILFSPSGQRGRFPVGTTVLQAARELGVDIDSICGGRARCGRCQVEPLEGTFPWEGMISSPAHLDDLSETELSCLSTELLRAGNRFSCQAKILGDVRIDVPPGSQLHQHVVRKEYEAHPIELDPGKPTCDGADLAPNDTESPAMPRAAPAARICAWTVTSNAVVGSSAISSAGLQERAIAIMARWRIPPES